MAMRMPPSIFTKDFPPTEENVRKAREKYQELEWRFFLNDGSMDYYDEQLRLLIKETFQSSGIPLHDDGLIKYSDGEFPRG